MYILEHVGRVILHSILGVLNKCVESTIGAGWRYLTSDKFMLKHEVFSYVVESKIMDVWDDFVDYGICPWFRPWASLKQVLTPFLRFFWGIVGESPVFWFLLITFVTRWIYSDYYRYLALGREGTPSTIGGWLRNKYLSFCCRVLLRVNVLSNPFLDSMTDPYRGMLSNLARRDGERPTILGLAQRQGDQMPDDQDTEAAIAAILERRAAEDPEPPAAGPGLGPSPLVVLHPADCAEVIQKGWGERHPLGCAAENPAWRFWHYISRRRLPLPHNVVLVYAPRNEAEMATFERIVDAAVWFATLPAPAGNATPPVDNAPVLVGDNVPVPSEDAPASAYDTPTLSETQVETQAWVQSWVENFTPQVENAPAEVENATVQAENTPALGEDAPATVSPAEENTADNA